jgi:hypothetical protein
MTPSPRLRPTWLAAALPLFICVAAYADPAGAPQLNSVANAVEGAESSWGTNPRMWRLDPDGPQGPMQVSAAAAADVGGGDRFDLEQNLALGRAYLQRMFERFGSWGDAVAAYNWGPGRMDDWIRNGRPSTGMPFSVDLYRARVLYGASLPDAGAGRAWGGGAFAGMRWPRLRGAAHAQPRRHGPLTLADRSVETLYAQIMAQSATR